MFSGSAFSLGSSVTDIGSSTGSVAQLWELNDDAYVIPGANGAGTTRNLGAAAAYIPAAYITTLYATVFGTHTDADGYNIILDTDGDTAIINDRDAGVADDEFDIQMNSAVDFTFAENLFTAVSGSAVTLAGGNLTVTGDGIFNSTTTEKPVVSLTNTTDDATGPHLNLISDRATPADTDVAGTITWTASDSGGTQTDVAQIIGSMEETNNDDEAGRLVFNLIYDDGTPGYYSFLDMSGDNGTPGQGFIMFNSDGGDVDFAINAGTHSDAFAVTGSNGHVGVGSDAGSAQFTVSQDTNTSGSPTAVGVYGAAHTTLATTAESSGMIFDFSADKEWATGAIATQREIKILAPTYKFVGASTITDAATVYIDNAPQAGTNATITNPYALQIADGSSFFGDTVSIGKWGYAGEHVVLPEASSNTNAGLGAYFQVDYEVSANKVFAGTYNRLVALTADQPNSATMVGSESQFRLRDVDIANGVHAGIWAYAEQSGTSAMTGTGTFDAVSAAVESEAGFSALATNHITGVTADSSINAGATIDAAANFSAFYAKSNGKDWFYGLHITGATTDIKLQNGETLDNATDGSFTLTGVGGTNNEDIIFDVETTADTIGVGTSTGVTEWDFGAIALATTGSIGTGNIIMSSAQPTLNFDDTDAADHTDNATIYANATDASSGSEDVDVVMSQYVGGALTEFFNSDADGSMTIGQASQAVAFNTSAVSGITTLALTQGITQAPTVTGNLYRLNLETEWTTGLLYYANFASNTTFSGSVGGIALDLQTNVTSANKDVDGFYVKLPAQTNTGDDPYVTQGLYVNGGAIVHNTGAGSSTWYGGNIEMPDITETTGTVESYGVYVEGGTVTSGTEYGIYVDSADSYLGGAVSGVSTITNAGLISNTVGAAEALRLSTNADDYTGFTMGADGGLTIQSIDTAAAAANIAITADGTFAVTSTGFNLSAAGAVSGITTLTVAGTVNIDDGVGDSPILYLIDADNNYLGMIKDDAGQASIINNEGAIEIKPSADTDDYISFSTAAGVVTMQTVAADSGSLIFNVGGPVITLDSTGTGGTAYTEIIDDDTTGYLALGRTGNTSGNGSRLSIVDGGADNSAGELVLYADDGNGNYFWTNTADVFRAHNTAPADDDAAGYAIMDLSSGAIGSTLQAISASSITLANYTQYLTVPAGHAYLGPTAPDTEQCGNFPCLGFDADAETVNIVREIPDDYVSGTDMKLRIYWTNEATDAIANDETVKWDISYRIRDWDDETYDGSNATTGTITYTEVGTPGTDKDTHISEITLADDDGDNPIVAGQTIGIQFDRDVGGDTYSGEGRITMWEIEYTSNGIINHH